MEARDNDLSAAGGDRDMRCIDGREQHAYRGMDRHDMHRSGHVLYLGAPRATFISDDTLQHGVYDQSHH